MNDILPDPDPQYVDPLWLALLETITSTEDGQEALAEWYEAGL